MKYISPITITDAQLDSTSVVETPPAAYNAGTTYALGDTCSTGTTGGVITVWRSLQNGNIGNTPNSSPTWWKNIGETYAAYDSGTTYAVGDIVLSATSHRIYESVQSANTGHNPITDDGTWWIDIGPTNRWACFDKSVGTVSRAPDSVSYTLLPNDLFNSIVLLDITGVSVDISVVYNSATIYDESFNMRDNRLCYGWWDYFFMPLDRQTTLVVYDLPPTGTVTITVNTSQGNAAVGTIAIGRTVHIGNTLNAPEIGIKDYSVKSTNEFGVTTVTERGYAKMARYNVLIDNARIDAIARMLASIRAIPVIWIGDGSNYYESLMIFGFFSDFGIVISYRDHSECRITIEGLST